MPKTGNIGMTNVHIVLRVHIVHRCIVHIVLVRVLRSIEAYMVSKLYECCSGVCTH